MSSATRQMAQNLSHAILNQNDLETVQAGAPAYLIMLDSLIQGDSENTDMLVSASKLYAAYTSAFVKDEARAKRLAQKSHDYAYRALCLELQQVCQVLDAKTDDLIPILGTIPASQQSILYAYASAWATWIQANTDDWNAIAQIPKLEAMFNRSIELDENYDTGNAHLYLGVLAAQIPPALGGKPDIARAHFEKAQQISRGQNLMVNVLFAEHYARLIFDQQLHDELLQSVIDNESNPENLVLVNTLARHRAAELLKESNEFF